MRDCENEMRKKKERKREQMTMFRRKRWRCFGADDDVDGGRNTSFCLDE